ncbi:Lrp/AsnC family transcriptional regulator [Marinobacterium mangrovicola]|uniref:AsnC family transcriptional regulator n=1 Tax=Marinobacterium mangrovicola TaxID=1476959 RepID=A0A4R1H8J6_9GAMM|nr:Lrp/AsnC family transcriptional regulator [Marinobacterium mangrovicola]TCK16405.1 AsnC family transcriptional regulator [Marinobacterium mangrovicola]
MTPLDRIDLNILHQLQNDASLSNAALSERINLSSSQCHRRVKRLEEEGYIARYVALLDRQKLGLQVQAILIIKASNLSPQSKQAFKDAISQYDMVTECWAIAGDKDIMVRIVAPSLDEYSRFLSEKIFSLEQVSSAETHLLLDSLKYTTEIPLPSPTLS